MGREATTTLNTKEQWVAAASVYGQLVARFGEPAVIAAAGRLKGVAKDDRGGPRGDPESKGALFWFTALLKDPKTQVPDVSHFLASSYDPRWMGKMVEVRGTVSRVELDTDGSPRYATIHFKESKNDRFTAFTPHSDILGQNSSGLVGKPIEIWGQVQDWREGSGVRFLISKQFKVLDAGAMANFRESNPDWMKMPMPAGNLVDSPKYLAWKKFPPGSKASYRPGGFYATLRRGNEARRPGQGGFGPGSKKAGRRPSSRRYPRGPRPAEYSATGGRVGDAHARQCGRRAKTA